MHGGCKWDYCPEKKIEAIQPLTSDFHIQDSIKIPFVIIMGPANSAQRVLLGLVCDYQRLASISQVERQNSLAVSY